MKYYMHLARSPFDKIRKGSKTIELRLYDEKRQALRVGDTIEFSNLEDLEHKLIVKITDLHRAESFEQLIELVSPQKCGSNPRGEKTGFMDKYYSPEKQKKYGALGIEFALEQEIRSYQAEGTLLSKLLRHTPDMLDESGFAPVEKITAYMGITLSRLEEIVLKDDKGRFFLSEDKSKIRANQGHSVKVDVEMEIMPPPEYLYHGTAEKYAESIEEKGLVPKSRLFVHLSINYDTAVKVGERHGAPVVYRVNAGQMYRDGFEFCRSYNGVWLTKSVPSEYLEK